MSQTRALALLVRAERRLVDETSLRVIAIGEEIARLETVLDATARGYDAEAEAGLMLAGGAGCVAAYARVVVEQRRAGLVAIGKLREEESDCLARLDERRQRMRSLERVGERIALRLRADALRRDQAEVDEIGFVRHAAQRAQGRGPGLRIRGPA